MSIRKKIKDNQFKDNQNISAIRRAKNRVDDLREKGYQYAKLILPQWLLLHSDHLISVPNFHRKMLVQKAGRLVVTGRPDIEYRQICELLIARRNQIGSGTHIFTFKKTFEFR